MKVAIVHYWLVGMRGGEKVVEQLCEMYPNADIFTHVYDPDSVSAIIKKHKVVTSFISKLPFAKSKYQTYLPLMPLALEQLDLRGYDLIISSESGPAKGVITDPDALHICYCHTPMRYLWDMYQNYYENAGRLKKVLMIPLMHYIRLWDVSSAQRVDCFIANSSFIAKRIKKFYRREAIVIHPPVAIEDFGISENVGDYYLMVGQLVQYKRTDLAVHAFNKMKKKLIVIGQGEELEYLKSIAGDTIEILGHQPFSKIKKYYSECKALIFPGLEDFGMVPIEAMASGRPVIAFGQGGALDYVQDMKTGVLFEEQSEESLMNAVLRFEEHEKGFDSDLIRQFSLRFSKSEFQKRILDKVDDAYEE